MKKLIVGLLLMSSPLWAARALLVNIEDVGAFTEVPSPTVIRWSFLVAYQGVDVPGVVQKAPLTVEVSATTNLAQLQSALVTAIRSEAINRGFTVPVGSCTIPSFSNQ